MQTTTYNTIFYELMARWKNETVFSSSPTQITANNAYLQIIGMGKEVIPLILSEMKNEVGHWFVALASITEEDPVLPEHWGNFQKMTDDWLAWGKRKGYI